LTFSIVAVELNTKTLGVAVASGSIAVGSRVPWVLDNVAAIATQAYTNIIYGREGLKLISQGYSPSEALKLILNKDLGRERRQVAMIDINNRKAIFTGRECPPWAGHIVGSNYIILGNLIRGYHVLKSMEQAFISEQGNFIEKLARALLAGENAGGDLRGDRSAALIVKGSYDKNIVIDNSKNPVQKIVELLDDS